MLTKLKLFGLVAIGVVFLISSISGMVGVWRVNNALNSLAQERTSIVTSGVTQNTMEDLERKVRNNDELTQDSKKRIDELQSALENMPDAVTVVKTEVVHHVTQKDSTHETHKADSSGSIDIALRAIDELWRDYCKRYPADRSCTNRKDYAGQVHESGSAGVPVPARPADKQGSKKGQGDPRPD